MGCGGDTTRNRPTLPTATPIPTPIPAPIPPHPPTSCSFFHLLPQCAPASPHFASPPLPLVLSFTPAVRAHLGRVREGHGRSAIHERCTLHTHAGGLHVCMGAGCPTLCEPFPNHPSVTPLLPAPHRAFAIAPLSLPCTYVHMKPFSSSCIDPKGLLSGGISPTDPFLA